MCVERTRGDLPSGLVCEMQGDCSDMYCRCYPLTSDSIILDNRGNRAYFSIQNNPDILLGLESGMRKHRKQTVGKISPMPQSDVSADAAALVT